MFARRPSEAEIIALGDALMAPRFSCGHPKIADNIVSVAGSIGVRCEVCRRRAERAETEA